MSSDSPGLQKLEKKRGERKVSVSSSARQVLGTNYNKTFIMELKKISTAVIVAAASLSSVMAANEVLAPAPGPSSGASATLPVVGSLVGASLVSFFAYYLH
ncbi:hypothetical protein PanWU01x14_168770 [Parasponia andersonii]|uniref:Transmembrane protein n=1 Tax=Parasponia andersonii TaxID=3476 RepID=A0A2P5CAP7_PARAD|nr:hypothetical protein PanWU01x14_168770 [Parasponia andersonii]